MRRWTSGSAWLLALALVGCNESTGPGGNGGNPTSSEIAVVNSISRTLLQFNRIDGQLVPFGNTIQLGPNYDGTSIDFIQDLWVSSTSAFGGSQIIFGAFSTGEQAIVGFPEPNAATADAGKPTVVVDAGGTVGAFVPARARDEVHIAFPGNPTTTVIAENVGTFVVRAVPAGDFILSMDANLDDEGDFSPNGPPRMVLHDFQSGTFFDALGLTGSLGATDGLLVSDEMIFVAGGSFDPVSFQPMGDGTLVEINVSDRGIQGTIPLGGNAISLEPGRNGLAHIIRTKGAGTFETDLLTFNFFTGDFQRGPNNPLQPTDSDGSDLNCWVATAFIDGEILCATFEAGTQGRLVLLNADGTFKHSVSIGAGATDIVLR